MRACALHYTTSDMHFTYCVNAKVCGLSQVVTWSLTQLGYWNHLNLTGCTCTPQVLSSCSDNEAALQTDSCFAGENILWNYTVRKSTVHCDMFHQIRNRCILRNSGTKMIPKSVLILKSKISSRSTRVLNSGARKDVK